MEPGGLIRWDFFLSGHSGASLEYWHPTMQIEISPPSQLDCHCNYYERRTRLFAEDILMETFSPSVRNSTEAEEGVCALYLPQSQLLSVSFYLLLVKKISIMT